MGYVPNLFLPPNPSLRSLRLVSFLLFSLVSFAEHGLQKHYSGSSAPQDRDRITCLESRVPAERAAHGGAPGLCTTEAAMATLTEGLFPELLYFPSILWRFSRFQHACPRRQWLPYNCACVRGYICPLLRVGPHRRLLEVLQPSLKGPHRVPSRASDTRRHQIGPKHFTDIFHVKQTATKIAPTQGTAGAWGKETKKS